MTMSNNPVGMPSSTIVLRDSTTVNRTRSNRGAIHLLATAFLSGAVFYRLGSFGGCSSLWLNSNKSYTNSISSYPNSPEYYTSTQSSDPYVQTSASRTTSDPKNDRRLIPRTSLPYDCGVVFFYHIPCTGGASINQWFKKYQRPQYGNISYYQHWKLETDRDGSFHPDPLECEADFVKGMSEHIQNLGPNEWRIAHSHLVSTYLNESEDLLYGWRSEVEAQGCELINAVMLRDPLNHAMSLHKIVTRKNSTRDEWTEYLSSPTGSGKWATVLDFFLYNNHGLRYLDAYPDGPGGRNPFNVTKEVKVARAMELLHRHFDIVTVGDHDAFMGKILDWTDWTRDNKYRMMNVNKKELEFTKKEVENMQKLLQKNGDVDFIDQVKVEYQGYLSYLTK